MHTIHFRCEELSYVSGEKAGWCSCCFGLNRIPMLSYLWVTLAFLISVAVGVIFGYYPASMAARLGPIVCLGTNDENRFAKMCRGCAL